MNNLTDYELFEERTNNTDSLFNNIFSYLYSKKTFYDINACFIKELQLNCNKLLIDLNNILESYNFNLVINIYSDDIISDLNNLRSFLINSNVNNLEKTLNIINKLCSYLSIIEDVMLNISNCEESILNFNPPEEDISKEVVL